MHEKKTSELDSAPRRELATRYAAGEMTIREIRHAGHWRMIQLLSDLNELGLRPPIAKMVGPNLEIRQAGIERLSKVLRS